MREKINRLANGIVDGISPEIVLEYELIELMVKAGEVSGLEFNINSSNKTPIKGLLYSSDYRVRILNTSFGGFKNKINIEIDARYMDIGEELSGSISLISNAGEFSIPFIFSIVGSQIGNILSSLKTSEDFAVIAKEDKETALRIFEYKDFIKAPFMKDYKIHALYESLSSKSNRAQELEEFLVKTGAKNKVEINIEKAIYRFDYSEEELSASVPIFRNTWGNLNLAVSCTEDFVELSSKFVTDKDFHNDRLDYHYKINKDKLHSGINTCEIIWKNIYETHTIKIEVIKSDNIQKPAKDLSLIEDKKAFLRYMDYRLNFEYASYDEKETLSQLMLLELESISKDNDRKMLIKILSAESLALVGINDKARDILYEIKEELYSTENKYTDDYIFYEYVQALIENNDSKKDSLSKIIKKMIENEDKNIFFFMLLRLDETIYSSKALLYEALRRQYDNGNRSPFLYIQYLKLVSNNIEFLHNLDEFEIQALNYGMKKNIISKDLCNIISDREGSIKVYSNLAYILFNRVYNKYNIKEYLAPLCKLLIKGDIRDKKRHKIFEKAIKEDISISGIQEYYIYTLPKEIDYLIPETILRYFKSNNSIDAKSRTLLYENILRFADKNSDIYKTFLPDIERFALYQLRQARLDKHLSYIYENIIKENMVDKELAKVLPTIASSYEIDCENELIKSIVVLYPELRKETVYQVEDKKAYIPIFLDTAIVLCQDAFGNRYANIDIKKTKTLNMQGILNRCYELYPENIMLKLRYTKELLDTNKLGSAEVLFLEGMIKDNILSDTFKSLIFSKLLLNYRDNYDVLLETNTWESNSHDILLKSNKDNLSNIEKNMMTDALISMGYFSEAYSMIYKYKTLGITLANIAKLCERMILDKMFKHDYLLLFLAKKSGTDKNTSDVILDYLCEYYNGSTVDMYNILELAVANRIETHDLEERLLAQMIFANNADLIDKTFALYVSRKKISGIIVKAYFTIKSVEYVIYSKEPDKQLFKYLENSIAEAENKDSIPDIYKAAMLKYFSSLDELDDSRREEAQILIDSLIGRGIILPFYKNFAGKLNISEDIINKEIAVYIAEKKEVPEIYSKVNEDDFVKEEFNRNFLNMFIKEKILFDGETWEYKVIDKSSEAELETGKIERENVDRKEDGSRFSMLNILTDKNEATINEDIKKYIIKDELSKRLFELI